MTIRARTLLEMVDIEWKGLDQVIKQLNKQIKKIEGRTVEGLTEAAFKVKADAVKLAPINTGNLRNSAYVLWGSADMVTEGGEAEGSFSIDAKSKKDMASQHAAIIAQQKSVEMKEPFALIGFTAYYALSVHENMDKNYRVGQAKFLEDSMRRNEKRILEIIRKRAIG